MKSANGGFLNYIETLQTDGQYWFIRGEIIRDLNLTIAAFKMAAHRLIKKKRILPIGKDFYIIIPLEYRRTSTLPPYWYIDYLMKYLGKQYYVGLLTAAAHYGASHQTSQQFHVMVNEPINFGKTRKTNLVFFVKKNGPLTPIVRIKVTTGYINMSSREATALDLVQYYKAVGHWGLVATILLELSPELDPTLLENSALHGQYETTTLQRLGYLLETLEQGDKALGIYQILQKKWETKRKNFILLTPEKKARQQQKKDPKWRIIVNDEIEADDI